MQITSLPLSKENFHKNTSENEVRNGKKQSNRSKTIYKTGEQVKKEPKPKWKTFFFEKQNTKSHKIRKTQCQKMKEKNEKQYFNSGFYQKKL